ncbi:MAG: hypothetical protein EBY62_10460 [Cellvibrionales bacterium]|nr:hypothetical protein [Cellvibrionales bacterium]
MSSCNRNFSSIVVDGKDRAPNRSMLRAVGFEDEDFEKPQVAVCSAWSMVTPCNSHLDELGKASVEGVDGAGGKAVPFGTMALYLGRFILHCNGKHGNVPNIRTIFITRICCSFSYFNFRKIAKIG